MPTYLNNIGSSTNIGSQQVNVYPQQQLSSVYANSTLNKIVVPGMENVSVVLSSVGDNISFAVDIQPGSTFYFQISVLDPNGLGYNDTIIGKITLNTAYRVLVPVSYWNPLGSISTKTLHIVADWSFDTGTASLKYLRCAVIDDSLILKEKSYDGSSNHSIVVCSLLNNQYYLTNWGGSISASSSPIFYHVAYDYSPTKNVFSTLEKPFTSFNIWFDHTGNGLYIGSGIANISGFVSKYTSSFLDNTGASIPYPNRGNYSTPIPNSQSGVTYPAIGAQYFWSDHVANTKIDVIATSTKASYYQVDFLRYRVNDNTHVMELVWESYLKPSGSLNFTATPLTMIKKDLIGYLQANYFPLYGVGLTLAVVIRRRIDVPDTQGATNYIWPEYTLVSREDIDFAVNTAPKFHRMKAPVYTASDLGLIG